MRGVPSLRATQIGLQRLDESALGREVLAPAETVLGADDRRRLGVLRVAVATAEAAAEDAERKFNFSQTLCVTLRTPR